jgi:hypothetical protein
MKQQDIDNVQQIMNSYTPDDVTISWRHIQSIEIRKAFLSHRSYLNEANLKSLVYISYAKECLFLLRLIKLKGVQMVKNENNT